MSDTVERLTLSEWLIRLKDETDDRLDHFILDKRAEEAKALEALEAENERLSLFEEWHTDLLDRMEGTIGSSVTDLMERVAFLEAENERLTKLVLDLRDKWGEERDAALQEVSDE